MTPRKYQENNHLAESIIWYSSGTVVEDNVVRTSRYGLHYMYSDDNSFRHNRFEDNEVGAAIMYSRRIELSENAFSFSNGPSAYGLLLKDADDVFITGNRFVHNATGLFFDGDDPRGSRPRWSSARPGTEIGFLCATTRRGSPGRPSGRR